MTDSLISLALQHNRAYRTYIAYGTPCLQGKVLPSEGLNTLLLCSHSIYTLKRTHSEVCYAMVLGRNGKRPTLSSRDSIDTQSSAQSYAALPAPSVIGTNESSSSPVSTKSTRGASQAPSPVILPSRPFKRPQDRAAPAPARTSPATTNPRTYRPVPQSQAPSGSWVPQSPIGAASNGIMPYPFPQQIQPQMPMQQMQMQQQPQGIMPYPYGPLPGQYPSPTGMMPWAIPYNPQMGYPPLPPYGQPYPGYSPYPPPSPPVAQEPKPSAHVKLQRDFEVARVSTAGMPSGSVNAPGNTPRAVIEGETMRVVHPVWTEEDANRFELVAPVEMPERVENLLKMQPSRFARHSFPPCFVGEADCLSY